ncbi:MAG: DUF4132 domain-containing protein [Pseudomonadota bacterium]
MRFKQLSKSDQIVLQTFKQHLPTGDALHSLTRSLEYIHLDYRMKNAPSKYDEVYEQCIDSVVKELGNEAESSMVEFLVNPLRHELDRQDDSIYSPVRNVALMLIWMYCQRHASQYTVDAVIARLSRMFDDPIGACEIETSWRFGEKEFNRRYLFPNAHCCLILLSQHFEFASVKDFCLALYQGDYNKRVDISNDADAPNFVDSCNKFIDRADYLFEQFSLFLFQQDEFTYDWFAKALRLYPDYVHAQRNLAYPNENRYEQHIDSDYLLTRKNYFYRFFTAQIAELPESTDYLASALVYDEEFKGIEWIKFGMQHIKQSTPTPKSLWRDTQNKAGKVIRALLNVIGLADGETDDELVTVLSEFDEAALLLGLPYTGYARDIVLKALGWDELIPLQHFIFKSAGGHATIRKNLQDIENSEDSNSGVIDRATTQALLSQIDKRRLKKYIKAIQASDLGLQNRLVLLKAVMGEERNKIEKQLVRHAQLSIKAYGLYPVESEEELRTRYLRFKAMHKEATRYGAERQANTQAAVQAGLKNLAQSAGYADEVRMEWALEADIVANMVPLETPFDADAWIILLKLEGITPRIQVSKQDKPLKSVPAKVRQSDSYKDMRETQDTMRRQASRFRKTLENMMCGDNTIPAEELATMSRIPVVNALLSQLIMQTESGEFGFFNGSTDSLDGLETQLSFSGNLRIAHVYHLFQAGVLPQWQQAIVQRRIVQPFKQVFRELYIVTPAEIEAGTHSRRFVGHVVDGGITSRLLQARGWTQVSDDVVQVFKSFPEQQFFANIKFPDSRHFLSGSETVTIDEIWFQRNADGTEILLEHIAPIIFSEVMRDADLLASVAKVDEDDGRWSTETEQRRTELITTLMNEIGLKQVHCEDRFAYVKGKLANYRIHLGSGAIHIQPGNYLCIIPEPRKKKDDDIYLPFADTDMRMAEIISKILLLANDHKIRDKVILEQIKKPD